MIIPFYYNPSKYSPEQLKTIKKLREAWTKYYEPYKFSSQKLFQKVQMRVYKGKFPYELKKNNNQ